MITANPLKYKQMKSLLRKILRNKVHAIDEHTKNVAIRFYNHWKHSPLRGQPAELLWELFMEREATARNPLASWGFNNNEVVLDKE